MEKIKNEKELLNQLFVDVDNCKKEKIVLLGGHFPLIYNNKEAIEAIKHWGEFSLYSLELACKVAQYAKKKKKKVQFVFFVDDHMYEGMSGLSSAQLSLRRNQLYKLRSGKDAELSKDYKKIMNKYGLTEKDVIRQNQGKSGRESCLYFSEKILRASKRIIDNPCAREYIEFLETKKYFNKKTTYMIAFIPQRCSENICNFALDREIKGLSGSHVFIDTMLRVPKKELYTIRMGVTYRRD
jgi:hypothetical protein